MIGVNNMKKRSCISQVLIFLSQIVVAICAVYPVFFMLINTFKDKAEYNVSQFLIPKTIVFENYLTVFGKYHVFQLFKNTLFIIVMMMLLIGIFCTLAAYAFAKLEFFGKKVIYLTVISMMMIPGIVVLIPQYYNMAKLGLVNNRWSVILLYTAAAMPYSIYLLTTNFRSIPNEIIESAKIDGANFFVIIRNIVLTIGKPGIITIVILNFTWYWNEFLCALMFLQKNEIRTMTVGIAMIISRFNNDQPAMLTGLFLTALPCIMIYMVFQRYIVKGIIVGALK